MSNDLAHALKTGHKVFHQRVANFNSWWMQLTDPIRQQEPQYKETQVFGLTVYSALNASPTPDDLISGGSTTALAAFEKVVMLNLKEARDNPSLITNAYMNLGDLAGLTLSRAIRAAVVALDSTVHPLSGHSSDVLEPEGTTGTVYICDDFTVKPPNGSPFAQGNINNAAFGATAVESNLAQKWEYLDYSGNETMTGESEEEKPFIIVPSDLQADADNLHERQGEIFDGSGLQSGRFNKRLRGVVTLPGNVADANDWWMWWKKTVVDENGKSAQYGPFAPLLRGGPRVTVAEAPDKHFIYLKGYMEYGLHYFADADQRVMMNKVA